MNIDELIECVARKLAGQYMVDEGYGEVSRINAEKGEMWKNFRLAAQVAISEIEEHFVLESVDVP